MTMNKTPIALTIAGSDSGGGAGIQADLKTFSALGVYGASVITALTAQNTREVRAIFDVGPEFITQQIDSVCEDLAVDAVKIGMLSQPAVIETVAHGLARHGIHQIVLDPVMVAKSGDRLLQPEAVTTLREQLLPHALLITPNLPEAAVLLNESEPASEPAMLAMAERLLKLGCGAVLLKGGHLDSAESADIFFDGNEPLQLSSIRIRTKITHGTGCTLSSAVTAFLARGYELCDAVVAAKDYVSAAIAAADRLTIGHGHGPVHHFHAIWEQRS
jgi:hydroxymethylpyrimidine/phosphomethylpyrimidine kinase